MADIQLNISKNIFNDAYYTHLFDYSKRYNVYYGGSGSGKSVFVTQKLLIKALNDKRKILVIRKVGRTIKDSVFQLFLDTLSQFKMLQYCTINKTDFTITLNNGSQILFKGLDDSEKIKSIVGITDIWFEECTEGGIDDYTQLDLRLRAKVKELQLYFTFNPVSKLNWVYIKWFADNAVIDNDTTFILKTTYKDNKFLPLDYVETLEKMINTNNTYYRVYALGEFCSLDKLVFTNYECTDLNVIELKQNNSFKLLLGLDFGFTTDPTALITSLVDETNKIIYVIDEFVERGLTNDKIADVIKYKGLNKSVIIADSAENKSIEEIKRFGITRIKGAVKGADSITQGIDKLKQYKIIINSICGETITEFQNYSYVKDRQTGEYSNKLIDKFNHCIDALRYSLQCIDDNKLKVLTKRL